MILFLTTSKLSWFEYYFLVCLSLTLCIHSLVRWDCNFNYFFCSHSYNEFLTLRCSTHCVKSVCIRSFCGPYYTAFWLNTESITGKYGSQKLRIRALFTQWQSDVIYLDPDNPGKFAMWYINNEITAFYMDISVQSIFQLAIFLYSNKFNFDEFEIPLFY